MRLVRDERGGLSTARCAFWLALIVTLTLVVLDGFDVAQLSTAAYTLLGTVFMGLTTWAAGPRIAQYLGPQIGRVASALGRASAEIKSRRKQSDEEHPGTEATP